MADKSGEGDYSRDEPEAARLDRNYSELLQELRVAQTGVQVLFAFFRNRLHPALYGAADL